MSTQVDCVISRNVCPSAGVKSHLSRAPSMSLCLAGGPPLPMSKRLRLRNKAEKGVRCNQALQNDQRCLNIWESEQEQNNSLYIL